MDKTAVETPYVYKIVLTPPNLNSPKIELSQLDKDSGFIHLSTGKQTPGTCDRFFNDVNTLYIIKFGYESVSPNLRWEPAPDTDDSFPHVYGDISVRDIDSVREFHRGDGSWSAVLSAEAWLSNES
jgi:uncharacterized protein (DUF952 family)